MSEYFCAGYVRLEGNKKGVRYLRVRDGEVIEEERLVFSISSKIDNPVGWIINIKKEKEGQYSDFNVVSYDLKIGKELIQKYSIMSVANAKEIDFENFRKKSKSIRATIENMTMKEIREWATKTYNKRVLKHYLLEMF